jgi:hypothetical protein
VPPIQDLQEGWAHASITGNKAACVQNCYSEIAIPLLATSGFSFKIFLLWFDLNLLTCVEIQIWIFIIFCTLDWPTIKCQHLISGQQNFKTIKFSLCITNV